MNCELFVEHKTTTEEKFDIYYLLYTIAIQVPNTCYLFQLAHLLHTTDTTVPPKQNVAHACNHV